MTQEEKEAREILNNTEWDGFMITIKNLIQKQDTEINKLNNVIDRMATWIDDHEDPFEDCHENSISCADIDCCKDCIKKYFMEDKEQ